MTDMRRGALAIGVLALASVGTSLALLAGRTWPFTSWSVLVFAAWIVFPAWLFHVTAPVALPRGALGRTFAALAPLALVGGCAAIGYAAWRQEDDPLPLAFIAVPAVQLAVAMPFFLFTGTDKRQGGALQEP
ncbi:MAG: hypothetical protein OXM56_05265 [Gammaproteobacteria bacterium]|nr:hypothetical protein [Gammaproteobacteria bacterium]